MKFENKLKEEILELLDNSENKSEAILEAIEKMNEAKYGDLIHELKEQAERAESDKDYAKSLNLRVLSKEEKAFYEKLKNVKQSFTGEQEDTIPTSIIDVTLGNVKKASGALKLVRFTPADVKKWISAEKSGIYVWGELYSGIDGEISAKIESLNIELSKLTAYLAIPKAIRDLGLPFIDRYFTAILEETLNDGAEYGYLQGNGKTEPIGIYKMIEEVNTDATHKDKTVDTTITCFSPKALASVKVALSNNGLRALDKIYLLCNPEDRANYVDPAMLDREGRNICSYKNLEVIECANNPKGKAAFTIDQKYDMGFSGFKVNEYKETKAMEDVDLIIAKAYANGRPVDDNTAFVFDVTKLEEYIPTVKTMAETQGA